MSQNQRIILTVTNLDEPFIQTWYIRNKEELWEFLNKHAQVGSGSTPKFPKPPK